MGSERVKPDGQIGTYFMPDGGIDPNNDERITVIKSSDGLMWIPTPLDAFLRSTILRVIDEEVEKHRKQSWPHAFSPEEHHAVVVALGALRTRFEEADDA